MPAFEITAAGFDGSTDATDNRVLWVWTANEEWLRNSLKAAFFQTMTWLDDVGLAPNDYDFIMPKDVQALHDRLRELAHVPTLKQMMRGADYVFAGGAEPLRVTFIASDPHDGAYLICKYWDTEKDEQAYIGVEASELRFLPEPENQRP